MQPCVKLPRRMVNQCGKSPILTKTLSISMWHPKKKKTNNIRIRMKETIININHSGLES